VSLPQQAINPATGKARMAIYLQDAHRIREGMEFTQYAESKGFEAVWQHLRLSPAPSRSALEWSTVGVETPHDLLPPSPHLMTWRQEE